MSAAHSRLESSQKFQGWGGIPFEDVALALARRTYGALALAPCTYVSKMCCYLRGSYAEVPGMVFWYDSGWS
eukprot:6357728-Pyramimonas_sp.AAC.1